MTLFSNSSILSGLTFPHDNSSAIYAVRFEFAPGFCGGKNCIPFETGFAGMTASGSMGVRLFAVSGLSVMVVVVWLPFCERYVCGM